MNGPNPRASQSEIRWQIWSAVTPPCWMSGTSTAPFATSSAWSSVHLFVQNRCQATDLQRKKKRTAQKINAQKNTRIMSNYFIVSWFWHRRTRLLNFSRNWSRNELWWCNQCGPVTTSTPCDSQGNEDNIRSKLNSKLPGLCGVCGERVWERRIGDQNKAKLCYCQEKANKEECTRAPSDSRK